MTVLRTVLGSSAVCAVVKANGYGHGAVLAAHGLQFSELLLPWRLSLPGVAGVAPPAW